MSRPGDRLRRFAALWCDERTMTLVVDPAVADLQSPKRAFLAGYIGVIKVVALCAIGGVMFAPSAWPAEDRRALSRTLVWSIGLVVIATALLELPSVMSVPKVLLHPSPLRYVSLAPQALAVALTIGLTLGLVFGLGGRQVSRGVIATAIALSLVASVVSFVNVGWIAPAANQARRVLMSGQPGLAPDIPEMTLGDIARRIGELRAEPATAINGYTAALAFTYHTRWALALSPFVYALFALSLFDGVRRRWLLALIACLSFVAYDRLVNMLLPWNSGLPPMLAAWSGNLVVLCVSAVVCIGALRQRLAPSL